MNPLTNMKNVIKLSEQALQSGGKSSWHNQYRDSAWIYIGGLPFDLSEGDIICIFSQYGEIVNINLIRAKDTGKSKGFCFVCYEDQRSTDLAVDNLNGIKVLNRTIRVDHVSEYKIPKDNKKTDEETRKLYQEGCAPVEQPLVPVRARTPPGDFRETIADQIKAEIKLPQRLPIYPTIKQEVVDAVVDKDKEKKPKKSKKSKRKKSKKSKRKSSSSDDDSSADEKQRMKVKITVSTERKRNRSISLEVEAKSKTMRARSRSHERRSNKSSDRYKERNDSRRHRR